MIVTFLVQFWLKKLAACFLSLSTVMLQREVKKAQIQGGKKIKRCVNARDIFKDRSHLHHLLYSPLLL